MIYLSPLKKMKPVPTEKLVNKKNGYQSDDDNVRYKINKKYFNKTLKLPNKKLNNDDDTVKYKLSPGFTQIKFSEQKPKPKPKLKVNFWSNKQSSRLHNTESNNINKSNRRHTVAVLRQDSPNEKPKNTVVKVRKRVSFLPSPLFSDNHVPMVTVPDDLTIQLNEEEANDLRADLNEAFVNSNSSQQSSGAPKKKNRASVNPESSPKSTKRVRSIENSEHNIQGNENELEFFSKYVVQKLRKMETNQRIYSENLINTVLMLGQLGKLNGKSKINDA